MKGGIGNILKQAQAMQENLKRAQEELAQIEVTGSAGGGLVSVTLTCRHAVRKVQIDASLLQDDSAAAPGAVLPPPSLESKEMLEDLVAAALNDAVRKVEAATQDKMSGLTGGLNIPGLKLPF